jgi:ABC-type transport system involved in multi-copper enzyme maturation permease subunit
LHYLLRLMCVVEIPTIFLCLIAISSPEGSGRQWTMLSALLGLLAALVTLLVSVHAANSIVSERVGQSLEVLLTTPLGAREIIRQKERALWRILVIASVPLLTVIGAEKYSEFGTRMSYVVCAISLIVIYLPMIMWLSLWISLRVRTRFQAIMVAIGTLAAWTALAPLLFHLTNGTSRTLVLLSPVSVGYLNEFNRLSQVFWPIGNPWLTTIVNAVLYGGIALFIRRRLYADAESLLRR